MIYLKTLLATLTILITSAVSLMLGGVISIEAINKYVIVVNYESFSQVDKSKIECVLRDEIGDIVGIGIANVPNNIAKVILGISSGDMAKICRYSMPRKIKVFASTTHID